MDHCDLNFKVTPEFHHAWKLLVAHLRGTGREHVEQAIRKYAKAHGLGSLFSHVRPKARAKHKRHRPRHGAPLWVGPDESP